MRNNKIESERMRNLVLDVAEKMFLKNGVSRTSLEMISRQSGISRAALYWHFGNKNNLLLEMAERAKLPYARLKENLPVHDSPASIKELISACIACMEDLTQPGQARQVTTILLLRLEKNLESRTVKNLDLFESSRLLSLFETIFSAQQEHLQPNISPRLASLYLYSFSYGYLLSALRDEFFTGKSSDVGVAFNSFFTAVITKDSANN